MSAKSPDVLDGSQATLVQEGVKAAPLLKLPNITNYMWVNQKSGLTEPSGRTKLYSCQNQITGLLYQWFRNLFCSHSLTGAHGNWRCVDGNHPSSQGQGILQTLEITDSTLTLSINHTGLLGRCGHKVYKGFPPKWSGCCGLGYPPLSVTSYSTLNASQCTGLGSFVSKVVPLRRVSQETVENPLCIKTPSSFEHWVSYFQVWRLWIGKSHLKFLHDDRKRVQYHHEDFENTPVRS